MELAVELVVKDGLEVISKNRCIAKYHSEIGKRKSPEMVRSYPSKKLISCNLLKVETRNGKVLYLFYHLWLSQLGG